MTLFRLTAPSVFAASVALLATGCFTDRPSDTPEADCEDTTSACDDNCTEADDADCDDDGSSADPDCENTSDECDDGCTEADADIDPDCAPAPDTGTAYLFTHGSIASDGTKVDATYGYMAKNLANDEWVCEMSATYSGSGDAQPGCPDCTFAFATEVTGGDTVGTYCDAWLEGYGAVFTDYSYSDFWWADDTIRDGWAFADGYTFVASDGTEYPLENVLFDHITYSGEDSSGEPVEYNGWYFRAYDFSAGGIDHVDETADPITWEAYVYDDASSKIYYYFYY